jgi:hypothetical protein
MTCIVGLVEGGRVHLGGDSQGTGGYSKSVRLDPKVFKRGKFVIGFTSSFRMGQVLQHKLNVPDQPEGVDDHEFMVTTFVDSVRSCFKDSGYARKEHEVEEGGTFLVGYKGKLYEIQSDYQVAIYAETYTAIGCGDDIAKGAMFAQDPNVNPLHRIQIALEAASRFSAGVGAPFNFVSSD